MDMKMPVMDGYEACRQIRSDENIKDIPIIALTADAVKEHVTEIKHLCNDYLLKPVNHAKLISLLTVLLPHRIMDALPRTPTPLQKEMPESSLPAETLARLPELIRILKEEVLVWEDVADFLVIHEIEEFAHHILELGNRFGVALLSTWGNRLLAQAAMLDVTGLPETLKGFPDIIAQIEYLINDEGENAHPIKDHIQPYPKNKL
jgi:response regulator RpfG family c-di-GMP phosphodiesterase